MIKNTSRIRNILLSLLFTFTILSASALAYDTVTYSFNVDNVNVLAYDCLDESCTAYKAFSGVLPSSSTTDGQLIVKYPAELATPYGYALFFTSPGYLPKEGKSDRHCPEGVPECVNSSSITLNKKAECSSTIEHVTDTINASSKVIINTTIQSAFRDTNTSVGFTPDSLKDDYYSVDTRVILKIFKGTTPVENSPWTKDYTKDSGDAGPPLYMDTVQDVEFTWTPTTYGTYTATVTTQVIDNQCSSSIDTDSPPIIINCINKKPVAEDVTTATDEDTQKQITLIATDTDGDSLEYEIMSGPDEGTATVSGDTVTYTPNLNYNGPDSFTYRAYDEQEYSNIATVSITVNPVNDAPVANANGPYSGYVNENVQFLGTATDIDGTIESYTWDFDNDGIIDSIEQNPTHAYTQTGTYTVIFSAADNQGATSYDTTTATISINPNPILSIDVTPSIEVDQGNNFTVIAILRNSGGNSAIGTIAISVPPGLEPNGTFAQDIDVPALTEHIFVWNITATMWGNYQIELDALYNSTKTANATVSITVNLVNDAPVAYDDSKTTDEDTPVSITLIATDTDGDSLTYTVTSYPSNGTLSGTAPLLTYTPNTNYNGQDSFTYRAYDGQEYSNTATVSITVNPINDAPVAYDDSKTTDEDTPVSITLTATDVDGDTLTYTVVSDPSHGTLTGTAPFLTYTPNTNYNGPDSFTFKAYDGTINSNIATITIDVGSDNDAPVAQDINTETDEDTPVDITLIATDIDCNSLTYNIVSNPTHGTVSLTGNTVTYTPNPNYNGPDSFTYRAYDGQEYSNIATVTITINPVNDAPVAYDDSKTTDEDTPVSITLTASDVDGDSLTYTVVSDPSHGTLTGTAPFLTYTPDTNYNGPDSFTFKANDGTVDSNIATVTIDVGSDNDAPVAQDITTETDEDTPVDITLIATDVDCNPLTYNIVSNPTHGNVSLTGKIATYTPDPNYNGSDSFTYRAYDGQEYSNTATVTITINPVNDAPVAYDDSKTTDEDTPVNITLTATDIDGDTLTYAVVSNPSHGTLTGTAPFLTYTPNTNYNGPDSFTFKAYDGTINSNIATITIDVGSDNDAPIAQDISTETDEDTPVDITLVATDIDCNPLTYYIVSNPTHGTVSLTGKIATYTPDPNYNGPDSFTYRAYDGQEYSNIATVTITVNPINDAPVAYDDSKTTDEDIPVSITLIATDIDGDSLDYTIISNPANGIISGTAPFLTYTPNTNYNGPDSFTYRAYDGQEYSNTATVTITVNPANGSPTDTEPPVINSVTLNNDIFKRTQLIHVIVNATDNSGILEIYVDEIQLTNTAGNIWEGNISPNQTLGTHNLTVIARDPSDNTATDTSAQYTVIDDETAPEPPTGLVVIALSNNSIRLSWISSVSDDIKYYNIYSSTIENTYNFNSPITTAQPDINMINITGLTENTTYYFVMKSVDNVYNEGNASEESYATTLIGNESNDPDGDRLPTDWENHYNQTGNLLDPDNNDSDADNITDDLEDPDSDNLNNYEEYLNGTDPNNPDTDNDTMPDGWEADNGLNPTDPKDGALDADNDGLSNADEYLHGTDPNNPDTDGDGYTDGWEIDNGTDPLNINDPTCHVNCGSSSSSSGGSGYTPPVEITIIENKTNETFENGTVYVSKIDLPDTAYIGQTITIKGCLIYPKSDTIDFMIDFGIVESLTLDGNNCFIIEYKVDLEEGKHNFAIVQENETLYSKDVLVYEYSITKEYIADIKVEPEPIQSPTGLLTWKKVSFDTIIYLLILLIIVVIYLMRNTIRAAVIKNKAK